MNPRLLTIVLAALLLILQGQLWIGRGSLISVNRMQHKLQNYRQNNQQAQLGNDQLAAEVRDLKEGLDMVEEKARIELGMVKPNEIFVQVSK